MIIKVCGMSDEENILEVAALDVDWIGFIFWKGSKRYVRPEDVERIRALIPRKTVKTVGVFVNAAKEDTMRTAARCRLDYIQLHGDEQPGLCRSLRSSGLSVIKAFRIADAGALAGVTAYKGAADYYLFDTPCEGYGGSGMTFDWQVLDSYNGQTPFLLSGGLNPGSVPALERFHHPRLAGIDLNSGFETAPGLKDVARLAHFTRSIANRQ
ncbi:MAG: phosphoribosylanthranilate isomerase [Tannerellaceae bacterium]|jgi:phosphoribosylanthranilate isomerase|nr:phosphoribosylanthranilate isomerase [Tannerellaceae bacterium]